MIGLATPKESNVYSQLIAKQPYDSFGVEGGINVKISINIQSIRDWYNISEMQKQ